MEKKERRELGKEREGEPSQDVVFSEDQPQPYPLKIQVQMPCRMGPS